ncbi:MAG: glycosyltransferase [Candidatus Sedimenticola sp. (ex Thyasira tokunagai)]
MRILFVQYGDYREAAINFRHGGEETYNAQRYSVEYVADLAGQHQYVGVICVAANERYSEQLSSGVHALGVDYRTQPTAALIKLIAAQNPTHIILRTPIVAVIKWACKHNISILPLLADSFDDKGIKQYLRNRRLRQSLNKPCIPWVANHNIGSSQSLQRIGVDPGKILPWDWPPQMSPDEYVTREIISDIGKTFLMYVGCVTENKGVGDTINSIQLLRTKGMDVHLDIFGGGEIDKYNELIRQKKLQQHTTLHGKVSHSKIIEEMLTHQAVIVPSRHTYPEGLPNVIYEALCTKTPLVVSDHPMFSPIFKHRIDAMVFSAGDENDMHLKIVELISDPHLYQALSSISEANWHKLQVPLKWREMIENWLNQPAHDNRELAGYALDKLTAPPHP